MEDLTQTFVQFWTMIDAATNQLAAEALVALSLLIKGVRQALANTLVGVAAVLDPGSFEVADGE